MNHFENSNGDDEDDQNICLRNEYLWVFVLLVFRAHILLKMLIDHDLHRRRLDIRCEKSFSAHP